MDRFRLDGKRALITGGSRGIGLGIARGLAEAGADVLLTARSREQLESAAASLADTGAEAALSAFDLTDTEAIEPWFRALTDEHGAVDILVNNAGGTRRGAAETLPLDDWRHVLELNLTALFVLSQAFGNSRIARGGGGRIINIASLLSEAARPSVAAYAASKGGVRQLTKALAVEWARHGINVNAIGPGYIRSALTEPLQEEEAFDTWVRERTPLGRWGTPGDLAGAAVFLASAASSFVTGQVLYVDGGWLSAL